MFAQIIAPIFWFIIAFVLGMLYGNFAAREAMARKKKEEESEETTFNTHVHLTIDDSVIQAYLDYYDLEVVPKDLSRVRQNSPSSGTTQ